MTSDLSSISQARVGFVVVHQGSLLVLEYEIRFCEWDRHISMLYTLEHDMVHGFFKGLVFPFYLLLEHLIADVSSFSQVVDHLRSTKKERIKTYRGISKSLCH